MRKKIRFFKTARYSIKGFILVMLIVFFGYYVFFAICLRNAPNPGVDEKKEETLGDVDINAKVGIGKIRFKVFPERRVPVANNWDTFVEFQIKNAGETTPLVSRLNVSTDHYGVGEFDLNHEEFIPSSTLYDVTVKGYSHLRKRFRYKAFTKSFVTLDLTTAGQELLAGDTHSSNDNYINSLDMSTVINALYSNSYKDDLNQDGLVNSLDMSNQIDNLFKTGDV